MQRTMKLYRLPEVGASRAVSCGGRAREFLLAEQGMRL